MKSSVAAVKSCEWSTGRRCSCRAKIPRSFVFVPVRWWWITPPDIIWPGLKFFLRRSFRPFVEKKMLKLCKMASPAVADGAAVWEAFRHLCQGSHYPAILQCFRFLVSLKKKKLGGKKLFSLWKIFFGILFEIHYVTLKKSPKLQTSSSTLKGACHYITSTDFWNLNAFVKMWSRVWASFVKWIGWMDGWIFWPGWDLLFVHFEDIWLLELHNNSPVGFSHIFLQTSLDRLSIFCTL